MSVAVVPSSHSQSQDAHAKPLRLVWRDWWTCPKYATGCAISCKYSLSLRYGCGVKAKAFTSCYDDPGISTSALSHGGINSVVEEVARDMGFGRGELDKLEVIEALLGPDGSELLESHPPEGITLREIIEDELEEEIGPYS
jgi:hypothetical protein